MRVVSLPNGFSASMYPPIAAKTTSRHIGAAEGAAAARAIARLANPPPNCAIPGFRVVGYETVAGWRVVRLEQGTNLGSVTTWDAPALGCTTLQHKFYTIQPDRSLKLTADNRLVSVELGEPDRALFDVPTDYQEMKPSDVQYRLAEKYNVKPFPPNDEYRKLLEDMDRGYFGTLRPNGRYWRDAISAPSPGH